MTSPSDNRLEQVALALYECDGGSAESFREETTTTRLAYYALARTAIEAMSKASNDLVEEMDEDVARRLLGVAVTLETAPKTQAFAINFAQLAHDIRAALRIRDARNGGGGQ